VTDNIPGRYNDTMGTIKIRMPEKIGDTKYRASFFNTSVRVETFFDSPQNVTCAIGFSAAYSGLSTGGSTRISLYQYANGSKLIEMKNA
ncbi:MAG: hypothetical protein QMD85_01285, partial [Candidatus Aenigmarchaeota archaeon]|nr:hypothetical protein [Candidatus Aenigmarchaeota archaeon]MDI6722185.1 hypothetical protein [Candidatus Aenigmarchaeota archaeon]